MEQFAFCYAVVTAFCLMFGIIVASKMNEDIGSKIEVRYFRYMVIAFILFCTGELFWSIGNFKLVPIPVPLLSLLSMLSMIAIGFLTFFWFCYGETKMGHTFTENPKIRALLLIPLGIAVVLYLLSPFTGWMYYYNEAGQFVQGPLYAIAIPLEQIYLLVISIQALIRGMRETGEKRSEALHLFGFIIVPAVACIFDAFIPTMPVIAPAIFSSIFFVFLGLQDSQIFNDALTGLNNRRRANTYLDEMIAQASLDDPLYVFMIDINAFKEINDTYGHLEGDRALRLVANAIKEACTDLRAFAARWGGDEFIVVAEQRHIASPARMIGTIKASVEQQWANAELAYPISISVGFAECTSPDIPKEFLEHEADEMLYTEKDVFYAAQASQAAQAVSV